MPFVPISLAMIVCDSVWRDPGTGKMTILGTFSVLHATQFPVALPQMAVYLALTDSRGKVPIKLQIVDTDESMEQPLALVEMELDFPNPVAILESVTFMAGVTFPAAGEYRLQLFASGEFVIERRIVVINHGGKELE